MGSILNINAIKMSENKDQIIYNLRQKVRELENKVAILERNVKDEVELSHSLMKKMSQTAREAPKT